MADINHKPTRQPAPDVNLFPTRINPNGIITNSIDGHQFPGSVAEWRAPRPPYRTYSKVFTRKDISTQASVTAGVTASDADANVSFIQKGPANKPTYTTDSTGTDIQVKGGGPNRPASAGALVLDPLEFPTAQVGDQVKGVISFQTAGVSVTVGDPGTFVGAVTEVGANDLGLSPGSLGTSFAGNPLLFRLTATFDPNDSLPLIGFQVNNGVGLYLPGTDTPLTPLQVVQRLDGEFTRDGNTFSLKEDFDLFEYRATVTTTADTLKVDYLEGSLISTVPEPASWVPLLIGGITVVTAWRRRARSGVNSLSPPSFTRINP
jgi:hypothetical protein